MTLDSYTSRNINLNTYIVTNYDDYNIDNDSFVVMSNLSGMTLNSNANSIDSREINITIHNSYVFTVIQPGNPDYDSNNPIIEEPLEENEYDLSFATDIVKGTEVSDTLSTDKIDIVFDKNTNSSNAPKYYANANGSEIRMYANNTLTVSSEYSITKISLSMTETYNNTATLSSNIDTLNEVENNIQTWTGSSNEVILTVSYSGQYRISAISVTILE